MVLSQHDDQPRGPSSGAIEPTTERQVSYKGQAEEHSIEVPPPLPPRPTNSTVRKVHGIGTAIEKEELPPPLPPRPQCQPDDELLECACEDDEVTPPPLPPRPQSKPQITAMAGDELPPPLPPRPGRQPQAAEEPSLRCERVIDATTTPPSGSSPGNITEGWQGYIPAIFAGSKGSSNTGDMGTPEREIFRLIHETNAKGDERLMYLKWRPLRKFAQKTIIGKIVRPIAKLQPACHWAIEVGPYTYEMLVEDDQLYWAATRWLTEVQCAPQYMIQQKVCGTTKLTDMEMCEEARKEFRRVMVAAKNKYSEFRNSCQLFANELAIAATGESQRAKMACRWSMARKSLPLPTLLNMSMQGMWLLALMHWTEIAKNSKTETKASKSKLVNFVTKVSMAPKGSTTTVQVLGILAPTIIYGITVYNAAPELTSLLNRSKHKERFAVKYSAMDDGAQ